jgi:type 1 glutamine amidotransferase
VASVSAPQKTKAIRTLVVTGGHAYDTSFYTVFEGYDDLIWDHAVSNVTAFNRDIRGKYDVLVLYDSSQELTDAIKKNLRDFLEAGKGLVVLHHAIVDYESWPWWYEEVVGGKYLLKPEMGMPASTYKHDEELRASVVEKHPVVAGLGAMHLMDETYKGMWISKKVKVLMTTDNPTSDGPLVWISPYQQSRVVYIQLGHDSKAHRYPAYQQLVRNGIQWAAGPSAK